MFESFTLIQMRKDASNRSENRRSYFAEELEFQLFSSLFFNHVNKKKIIFRYYVYFNVLQ